ncbi:DUF5634 family protein [Bacillus timonensis]|nr:DUF5634 family protein [Bacillus timonensis]
MTFESRNDILQSMIESLHPLLDQYDLDDIGIYEEEGEGDEYYMGYTFRKNGKVFMINMPYVKNRHGELAPKQQEWTIQEKEGEAKGFQSLDEAFHTVTEEWLH